MSTIFEVHPSIDIIPTYVDVLDLSNKKIKSFLEKLDVRADLMLKCELKKCQTNENIDFCMTDKAIWSEENYVWFYFPDIPGGCDTYCNNLSDLDFSIWEEELVTNVRAKRLEENLRKSMEIGFEWRFRRSVGQPAIINLAYGLIAASFAEITEGLIFSDDGAWDYNMFPAIAEDFLEHFFDPNYEKEEYGNWARNCIDIIIEEYK